MKANMYAFQDLTSSVWLAWSLSWVVKYYAGELRGLHFKHSVLKVTLKCFGLTLRAPRSSEGIGSRMWLGELT